MHRKLALAVFVTLAGCVAASAEVTELVCTQTAPTEYKLTYAFTGETRSVAIMATTDPTGAKGMEPVMKTSDTSVTVHAGKAGERVYFFLKPDHGERRVVSIRHLALEGTPNFRDLGGYETTDGKFVRWGLLYRSGVLSNLTANDFAYLSKLDVRVVCDFRTAQENATAPEIWVPGAKVEHVSLPIGGADNTKKDVTASLDDFMATNPTPEQVKAWMTKSYGSFAFTNAREYASVFAQMKQDHLPLLYHCSAGKDRTGVFSAFVLLTLGVPEKTVLEDYALTNKYLLASITPEQTRKMLANNPQLAKMSDAQQKVLMSADPDFLKSTLRQIDEKFGSFDNYRRTQLGVSDADVAMLRARLLEK